MKVTFRKTLSSSFSLSMLASSIEEAACFVQYVSKAWIVSISLSMIGIIMFGAMEHRHKYKQDQHQHAWSMGMAWMKRPPTLTPVSSSSPVAVARSTASFNRRQKEEFTCDTVDTQIG